jgi:3-isopropylmalate dehydratase small subunit
MNILRGMAHAYGDNIDTDRIIPGKYTKTLEIGDLVEHVLEDLDPQFASRVRPGDIIVAGDNFGCGSSREQAPLALQAAGVAVVVSNYFARIFYRNAINVGLPVVEIKGHRIESGHLLEVDLTEGVVRDLTSRMTYEVTKMPRVMMAILEAGGLVFYLRAHGDFA